MILLRCVLTVRLTPAGAGSTDTTWLSQPRSTAYPRRCGEHRVVAVRREHAVGLPPQVRGAPDLSDLAIATSGLTPAGAGSTIIWLAELQGWQAYPRRCGEHHSGTAKPNRTYGLPPQVRGARFGDDPQINL